MSITALILTYNEELHLKRCLKSVQALTSNIVVVDSYSSDKTCEIAREAGATLLQNAWENNHSTQVNWALGQLPKDTQWVMRIDADEILTPELIAQIQTILPTLGNEVNGITCYRKMVFQDKLIRFGGVGANVVLRLFRYGHGQSESRWMDEHISVRGPLVHLNGAIIDHNLQSLAWWKEKHRNYAKREAIDLLNLELQFNPTISGQNHLAMQTQISFKRRIKESVYAKLPCGARAMAYFFLRYFILAGFLDGRVGAQFHYLQAYWYRNLADQYVALVKRQMKIQKLSAQKAIAQVLDTQV